MSTKSKGKGKKKGKDKKVVDPNKLTQVDRTFYELTIADLNKKLARLRTHVVELDETNVNVNEKLRALEEDRVDVASHLERTLINRNDRIQDLEDQLSELTKVREEENRENSEIIKSWEAKYKAMHDQLQSEIKLLNGKLNSLDEFRIQRDVLMAKFEDQEATIKEKDRTYGEALHDLEQKQIVERDILKKQVEYKLLKVAEDFTRSSEIRNAGYSRRLIRENVALQKEIDVLIASQIKMHLQIKDQTESYKQMVDKFEAQNEIREVVIKNAQNKTEIIEKLMKEYEDLKVRYIEALKYRALYEKIISRDVCERFTVKDLRKKVRYLSEVIETLQGDKRAMAAVHTSHELEILRLRKLIDAVKQTLLSTIMEDKVPATKLSIEIFDADEVMGEGEESELNLDTGHDLVEPEHLIKQKRRNLLSELINIMSSDTTQLLDVPSVSTISGVAPNMYKTGKLGLLPAPDSLFDIFRHAKQCDESESNQNFLAKTYDSKIIPKQRSTTGIIIDTIEGDPLYVSSSHEDQEIVVAEEEPLEGEEASSSDMATSEVPSEAPSEIGERNTSLQPAFSNRQSVKSKSSKGSRKSVKSLSIEAVDEEEEEEHIDFFY